MIMSEKTKIYSEFIHQGHDIYQRLKYLIPFIGYPLNRDENYNPFFIIGSGRSGNTLLRRILHAHESLFIPPETYVLGKIIKLFRQNRNMIWRNLVYLILSHFEFHPEFFTFGVSLRPLAQELINIPKNKRSLAYLIDGFYHFYAKEKKLLGIRWGDKSPINTYCLKRIYLVFPKAQFIHIIRDGYDVIKSYLESGIYNNIELVAKRWLNSVKLASRFGSKYPKNYFEIHYEELVQKPEETVTKICKFLDIRYNSNMIYSENTAHLLGDIVKRIHHSNVMKPIFTSSIGKGRKNLTYEQRIKIQKIIGKKLELLGYEP